MFWIYDSAIRVATQWNQKHLGGATRVLLVTNDRENKRKATEEGIFAETSMHSIFLYSDYHCLHYSHYMLVEFFVNGS